MLSKKNVWTTEAKTKSSGLKKIMDLPKPCNHPEHDPPGNIVLSPGVYEYTCPACGYTVTFTVDDIR